MSKGIIRKSMHFSSQNVKKTIKKNSFAIKPTLLSLIKTHLVKLKLQNSLNLSSCRLIPLTLESIELRKLEKHGRDNQNSGIWPNENRPLKVSFYLLVSF